MTPLISCQELSKSYGARDLFTELSVALFPGNRVGLIGPNGAGKSTLLKLLAGIDNPDLGTIVYNRGLRVAYVHQHIEDFDGTVEDAVEESARCLEACDAYERHARVRKVLGALGFADPTASASALSGGWRRRLSVARALVLEPDVLLLDEPTNHLDLDGILWLEGFLKRERVTFVVTSHDRVFLDNICTQIWEISHSYPGGIFTVDGAYAEFMERRAAFLAAQVKQEQGLRSKMRREEEWLRQTPKARTTKSRSRIQEAAKLQQELGHLQRRNQEKKSQLSLADSGRQTKKLITAKNIGKTIGEKQLFSGIDIDLQRGDRLGIVGDNGSGKSTLLKILARELESDTGTTKYAEGLDVFYFDQHRDHLDLDESLRLGLSPSGDTVHYQGGKIHVNSWAERFLFDRDRLDLPMRQLSGGERARVLIARLMLKSSDVLLLDEPTNDLDIDTLELLEEGLDAFPGAVVLVTHDRAMMDRVSDRLLALGCDKDDRIFNDTASWLDWREQQRRESAQKAKVATVRQPTKAKKQKLGYREQQELAGMEQRITELEGTIELLAQKVEDPTNAGKLQELCDSLGKAQSELDRSYARWQELEERQ